MTYRRQTVALNNLLLDTENARHGKRDDQNAVLKWMASQSKVQALARSIAKSGLNPSELIIVIPVGDDGNLYVVVEGNRRTAALKMLNDPDKCPDETVRRHYRKMRADAEVTLPSVLDCVVYPDLESAALWIRTRHLGEQEGAGTVPWGAKEIVYFERRLGRRGPNEASLKILEYARENGLINTEEYDAIPITNVTRLINTPDVRRELGMDLRKGEPYVIADVEFFNRALRGVLKRLASPNPDDKITVSDIKTQAQRTEFIKEVKEGEGVGSYIVQERKPLDDVGNLPKTASQSVGEGTTARSTGSPGRTSHDPTRRPYAIASNVSMKIENPKLLSIFRELKKLMVDQFPNAAAVLTRVFIEGCTESYITKHNLSRNNLQYLKDKVIRVRKHMIEQNPGTSVEEDLKGLEVFAGDHQSVGSANSFNAVVHNNTFRITGLELKVTWDRLQSSLAWFEGHV